METSKTPRLIDLGGNIDGAVKRSLYRLVEQPFERALSVEGINLLYQRSLEADSANYFETTLQLLDIAYDLSAEDRAKMPTTGPLIVVANHPFGTLDALILGHVLTSIRTDVRLVGDDTLPEVPPLRRWTIPVDRGALGQAIRWLRTGGALGGFPAMAQPAAKQPGGRREAAWHPTLAALVRRTGATVVPVFFEGASSLVSQVAGLLHPSLRRALVPRELARRAGTRIGVRIGRPIGPEKVSRYSDDATLLEYLRWKTMMLQRRESPIRPRFLPRAAAKVAVSPIIEPVPTAVLQAEVQRLPPDARLVEQGDYQVFAATASQIPAVLREIGRLREVTFRAVSEGTGRALDIDRFDEKYLHLFMWHRTKAEVVGSYRIGRVDQILANEGLSGLYTTTLFKFKAGFLERTGPSLELGRSFIRAEYQRKPTSLALLWRGIGEILVRNPHYKVLFGPVSISREYQGLSKRLMVDFLARERGDVGLEPLVRAKNPPRDRLARHERAAIAPLVKDVDDLSALISEIEDDSKGMPILLRHYLRLGARLLSFNVDEEFGHCIDGLIVVDLRKTQPKLLRRFMGEEGLGFYASVP